MKVAVNITKTHNPFGEDYWASCLRENLTSSSYGEGLEKGREFAQEPRQSFTRQQVFRHMKSVLETRPIFHKLDETIRGHVFCSFLALVIRKELDRRLEIAGHCFEWADIKQVSRPCRRSRLKTGARRLSSAANATEPAAGFSRRSAWPSRRRSGRWHDVIHVVKEQSVVPRTFSGNPSI